MNVKITSADFKDWAREHRSLALAVCRAQAAAELTRARVDAYIKPIFESFGFVYSGELAESLDMRAGRCGRRLTGHGWFRRKARWQAARVRKRSLSLRRP